MAMTPQEFIDKWRNSSLTEQQGSHQHFLDLCELLNVPKPADIDPAGEWYTFEKGAKKDAGTPGWADVWKRGHFAWEYKGQRKDLDAAFTQLRQYVSALDNPPLLIVSDMERIRIRTNWTNTVTQTHELGLEDLADAKNRALLKAAFSDPEQLRPDITRQALTEQAAESFAGIAQSLRERGHDPQEVAHFVNRLVFCLFADDVGLLPNRMFRKLLERARENADEFVGIAIDLFGHMKTGGYFGVDRVEWFNGGLFDSDMALPLDRFDITTVWRASQLNWSEIDPSIFGTLFERGLDPDKRSQLGAHYTDRDKIMQIIEPVIVRPLLAEWAEEKAGIATDLELAGTAKSTSARQQRRNQAQRRYTAFLDRLRSFTVLDPACGSGNFLYLALQSLKDLEKEVQIDAEELGFTQLTFPQIGPANVKGIEINPYAAELARVSVWIGEIQWMRRNGFAESRDPILKPLDTIECRDAILAPDGTEPDWPDADVVIGNPPFLGNRKIRRELGDNDAERLPALYAEWVGGKPDLVCYWFAKAGRLVADGRVQCVGLVATNSISGGTNRRVLDRILDHGVIFEAWSDEPWVIDGAAVRVSLICFARQDSGLPIRLDGEDASRINADLTAGSLDLTAAVPLKSNRGVAFQGDIKRGPFDITGDQAREWLCLPSNPNGRTNADILKPWVNGMDLTRRSQGKWIIDFGDEMGEKEAALYETPFAYALENIRPVRQQNREQSSREFWFRHWNPRPAMWTALGELRRYIVTPRVAKHRLFVWLDTRVCPDSATTAIARDDDTTFGILHSRFHEIWSLRLGTWLGKGNDPRYTPTTTLGTFPFPEGLTPDIPAADYADDPRAIAIADAARRLVELRDRWLNPPEWVEWVDEPVPGYPKRPVPRNEEAATSLKNRTLTKLYNERPQWLADVHAALDAAVAAAYGWPADISDDDVLRELLDLNRARSAAE